MAIKTLRAPVCVRVISLGMEKVKAISIQPKNYDFKEPFTREIVEAKLEELREEKKLELENIKVLSVEKENSETQPFAVIERPLTIHDKILDAIRIKLWDKGAGIAVKFVKANKYKPYNTVNDREHYKKIMEEEKKSRGNVILH